MGEVKSVNENGEKVYLENIIKKEGEYYATHKGTEIHIDTTTERKFYIKNINPSYNSVHQVWIKSSNNKTSNGVLYQVKDSSILLIISYEGKYPTTLDDYSLSRSVLKEYFIKNIEQISIRPIEKVRKSAGKGAAIGVGVGVLFIPIVLSVSDGYSISDSFTDPFALVAIGLFTAIGASSGALIGAIVGSKRDSIYHLQDLSHFNKVIREDLSKKAIVTTSQ
jgi:hypothetical protein